LTFFFVKGPNLEAWKFLFGFSDDGNSDLWAQIQNLEDLLGEARKGRKQAEEVSSFKNLRLIETVL